MDCYRLKPAVVQAEQFKEGAPCMGVFYIGGGFYVNTANGPMNVSNRDWVVKLLQGHYIVLKPEAFALICEQTECYE